jgi:transaldolase
LARRTNRENAFIKVPGTTAGLRAVEELTYRGVPVNITLLFSPEQYDATAEAYLAGLERRISEGLSASVHSVASVFISRWDVAVKDSVPPALRNKLGVAIARLVYARYRVQMASQRWQRALNFGAPMQRLLWASTGVKDPVASALLYAEALAAPLTINTMPDVTLHALGDLERVPDAMGTDVAGAEAEIATFREVGVDPSALGERLQFEGLKSFNDSWEELLKVLADKGTHL